MLHLALVHINFAHINFAAILNAVLVVMGFHGGSSSG